MDLRRNVSDKTKNKIEPYKDIIFDLYWNENKSFNEISKELNLCSPSSIYRYMKQYSNVRTKEEQLNELKKLNTNRVWSEEAKHNMRVGVINSYKDGKLRKKRSEDNKRIWSSMTKEERYNRTKNGIVAAHNALKSVVISSQENKVAKQLDFLNIRYIQQKCICNGKYYLDFYIPKLRLVIECNGKYWHSLPNRKQRDKELKEYVESTGRKIIFIWDYEINDEWFWIGDYIKEV